MRKTNEMKKALALTFTDKGNWNRWIEINGDYYIYISAKNEIRKKAKQPSGTMAAMVGCFINSNNIMWCC